MFGMPVFVLSHERRAAVTLRTEGVQVIDGVVHLTYRVDEPYGDTHNSTALTASAVW